MNNEWFRFYSEFVDDPKIKRLAIEDWGVWIGLLCLACKSPVFGALYIGKNIPYETSDLIASFNGLEGKKIENSIKKMEELDMLERDEKGSIVIKNFRSRQSSDHPRMITERVNKYRLKQGSNENVTEVKQGSNALDKIRVDKIRVDKYIYTPDFEKFFKIYPKKVGKKKAFIYWKKLKQEERTKIMADIPKRMEDEKWIDGFIKDPERYIKDEQWEDEIKVAPKTEILRINQKK